MKVVIFEDNHYEDFYPIVLTRPVWDVRCGLFTIWERYCSIYPSLVPNNCFFFTRPYLELYSKQIHPSININVPLTVNVNETVYYINARVLYPDLNLLNDNVVYITNDIPVVAKITHNSVQKFLSTEDVIKFLDNFEQKTTYSYYAVQSLWELVSKNNEIIKKDYSLILKKQVIHNVTIIGDKSLITIEDDVIIEPYVVIDCTKGPVYIANASHIRSFTRIDGPCYIGQQVQLMQAKIREGCSIGPQCRIGGEVEQSIFQGFSNKYHDGFIGHSYIGQWVNLGALTTNSDLKNNYTHIKLLKGKEKINTGLIKVGCFIGDYTMTSIGTLINTGTIMGPGCMVIHHGDITPKFIPPFSWYIDGKVVDLPSEDKFFATCKTMMSRRNVPFTTEHRRLLEKVRDQTKMYRKDVEKWNVPK